MLSSQQSRLCSRWRLQGRSDAEKTSTENKCTPRLKLLALSRSDASLTEFSAAKSNLPARILLHLTPCHGRHIPPASPSLISLLMNHFTRRWNVTQWANIGRITNLLISYWAEWGGGGLNIISDFQHFSHHQDWYCLQRLREKGSKDESACLLWQRWCTLTATGVMCAKWALTWVCDSLVTANSHRLKAHMQIDDSMRMNSWRASGSYQSRWWPFYDNKLYSYIDPGPFHCKLNCLKFHCCQARLHCQGAAEISEQFV